MLRAPRATTWALEERTTCRLRTRLRRVCATSGKGWRASGVRPPKPALPEVQQASKRCQHGRPRETCSLALDSQSVVEARRFFLWGKKAICWRPPAGRHVALEVVAAVLPVVPRGVRVHGRRKGTEIWAAKGDFPARVDESGRDVVEVRVVRRQNAALAHKAGDKERSKW